MPAEERKVVATNRKARHDYHIISVYEAGLVLSGTEVKSLREGRASLTDSFVSDHFGELFLERVYIPEYSQGSWTNHAARRKRKLLLHRKEIDKLVAKASESGHTIVPLSLYFVRGKAKVEIALVKGKKFYDKRQSLREQQDRREAERAMSARVQSRRHATE